MADDASCERHWIEASCEMLEDDRGSGSVRRVVLRNGHGFDRIRSAARTLFAGSCGQCDAPYEGCYPLFATTLWTQSEGWAAVDVVKATFDLMKTVPVGTRRRRGDGK